MQRSYHPTIRWTEKWYEIARDEEASKKARDEEARRLKREGWKVRRSSTRNQLLSFGGIGTGRPHITICCTVYRLTATKE